jgi:hypothetical protein
MGVIETAAAPVYSELLENRYPYTIAGRENFSAFVSLTMLRSTAARKDAGDMMGKLMQTMMYANAVDENSFDAVIEDIEKKEGRVIDQVGRDRIRQTMTDMSNFELHIRKEATLTSLAPLEQLTAIISKMKWCLVRPRHGFFITCDNPLVRQVAEKSVHRIYGDGGFMNPST